MSFPKVLIFGQPFNNFSGGGITLSNLFKGWTKDKIAVAFIGHGLINVTTDICDTYYQLGKEEHKWIFPFNLINRDFPSGLKSFNPNVNTPVNLIQKGLRYFIVNQFFYPFLRWIGLFHCASKISVSKKFSEWLSEFRPDILYLQVSSRETLVFANQLTEYLQVPSVLHIMDDWLSIVSRKGILKNYWQKKIDTEFKQLLNSVHLHLSISDSMSEEYKKRYNKDFIAFHNPIEITKWLPHCKRDYVIDREKIKMLYSGRLGIGVINSLTEVVYSIDSLKKKGYNIELHIQTPSKERNILNQFQKHNCVVIDPFVKYEKLPEIFSGADILILTIDFGKMGKDYLRFSMPTKVSEYMISGTPVLVYAPENTAVSKFFSQHNCGICITSQSSEEITKAIQFLIENKDFRQEISNNAVNLAKEKFDVLKVRNDFQYLLKSILKTNIS